MSGEKPEGGGDAPEYKVYKSRRGLGRLPKPDVSSLRSKLPGGGDKPPSGPKMPKQPRAPGEKRRWVRWVFLGIFGWILLSFIAFAVSAQIQKASSPTAPPTRSTATRSSPSARRTSSSSAPTRARPGSARRTTRPSEKCLEAAGEGKAPPEGCEPYRSDTIMVVRAGGGTFRKLSIPRDTLAEVPGVGATQINAAYANGGAKLTIETVENFLGIDIDHVAIVDFTGFKDFIDALGGITVDLDEPVCSEISGGAENGGFTLDLKKGENDLDGEEALSLARTRTSGDCNDDGSPDSDINDLDRVRFQQEVISGIKGKLTSPLSFPLNFIRGPLIGWNAPKALVTDMGALTMPQLLFASVIGGDSPTEVLEPEALSQPLIVPQEECLAKVKKLIGGEPEREPACSPVG